MTAQQPDFRRPHDESVSGQLYRLDVMSQDDVPAVSRVERRCFPNPWPASAYRRELQNPTQNYYVVLRAMPSDFSERNDPSATASNGRENLTINGLPRRSLLPIGVARRQEVSDVARAPIVGFAGMWMAFDEAHVTTIGVDPEYRGRGLGELLLLCMFDAAIARRATWLTLEVRVSNDAAQALYRKYGFSVQGARKRYYSDNNEDALIMWSRPLSDPGFLADIDAQRRALAGRLAAQLDRRGLSPFSGLRSQVATP